MISFIFCLCLNSCDGTYAVPLDLDSAPVTPETLGPIVAKVDGDGLRLGEIDEYFALARNLRAANDLPAGDIDSGKGRLDLAIELVALAVQARAAGIDGSPVVDELTKRLLARAYLDRLAAESDRLEVSDSEIRAAFEREKARYMATGYSDIFEPSSMNFVALAIGFFPDLHVPGKGEQPVCSRDQAIELGKKIHASLAGSAPDLDVFMSDARRFELGHPTLVVNEYWRTLGDPQLSGIDPTLHTAAFSLRSEGDLSEPVVTDEGVFIVRRGYFRPGKGERLSDVRDALVAGVRNHHRHTLLQKQLSALLKKYGARTWPERLADSDVKSSRRPGQRRDTD